MSSSLSHPGIPTVFYPHIYNWNLKIGPNSWSPGTGWTLQTSGSNYAVWMK